MAGEVVNMNISLNNINAAGMSGLNVGVMGETGAMKSMEALSASLTTPGNNEAPSDAMDKLTCVGDNKIALAENANKINGCNSYLEACKGSNPQGAPLSDMKAALNPKGDVKPDELMSKCLDKCFGEAMGAQEKIHVVNFYNKAGVAEAPKASNPTMTPGQASNIAGKAQVDRPAPNPAIGNQQATSRIGMTKDQLADKVMGRTQVAAELANKPNVPSTPKPSFQPAKPEVAPRKENPVGMNPLNDLMANQPSMNEMLANIDLDARGFGAVDAGRFKMPAPNADSSVLAQYMQQNGDTLNNAAEMMNEYMEQMGSMEMPAFTGAFNGDAVAMPGMMAQNGSVNPLLEGTAKPGMSRIDLVGSTAMSTNMANLENLVNTDLMNDLINGEGLRKA